MRPFITGFLISMLGIVATALAYASGNDWQLYTHVTLSALIIGIIAFVLVWLFTSKYNIPYFLCFFVGYVPIIASILLMILISLGDAESMMWMPVMVIVAVIYGLPIALCSSAGGNLAGRSNRNKNAEQAAPSNP